MKRISIKVIPSKKDEVSFHQSWSMWQTRFGNFRATRKEAIFHNGITVNFN